MLVQQVKQRGGVVQVHPWWGATTGGRGGQRPVRVPLVMLELNQTLAKRFLDQRGQRPVMAGRVRLGLGEQLLIQANGGPHASKHTLETSVCHPSAVASWGAYGRRDTWPNGRTPRDSDRGRQPSWFRGTGTFAPAGWRDGRAGCTYRGKPGGPCRWRRGNRRPRAARPNVVKTDYPPRAGFAPAAVA